MTTTAQTSSSVTFLKPSLERNSSTYEIHLASLQWCLPVESPFLSKSDLRAFLSPLNTLLKPWSNLSLKQLNSDSELIVLRGETEEASPEVMAYSLGIFYLFYFLVLEAAFFDLSLVFALLLLTFSSALAFFLEGGVRGY